MSPKPMAQKVMEPMEKSIRFFIMMLMEFLARVKPACMKNTRAAATSVHR